MILIDPLEPDDQQSQNPSLDSSASSQADYSTLTNLEDLPNWLEDQQVKTKKCYQAFFQYFDFSIRDKPRIQCQPIISEVSDDQIRRCVQSAREMRKCNQSEVTLDSESQMGEYEAIFIDSESDN